MHLPFHCPICNAPITKDQVLCDECRRQLDAECFDNLVSRCPVCRFPRLSDDYVCVRCRGGSERCSTIYPVASYNGRLGNSVILSFKFLGHKELAPVVALYLDRALKVLDPKGEALLVPVPCSEASLARNGWDHMVEVCKALGRPFLQLVSNVDGPEIQQKTLGRRERLISASGKFRINPVFSQRLDGFRERRIIVADDIATTLSTMISAIGLLERNGFRDVVGATWLCEL